MKFKKFKILSDLQRKLVKITENIYKSKNFNKECLNWKFNFQ